jgi:hypothetical protein
LTQAHIPVGQYPHSFIPQISCISASLCIAISSGSRTILTTVDPSGDATNWRPQQLAHPLETVTCTRPELCVLGDDHGDVRTSTNPSGGRWTSAHIFGKPGAVDAMGAAACGSTHHCLIAALFGGGSVLILATKPTKTTPRTPGVWQDQVAIGSGFTAGSCVGTFCAYVTDDGKVDYPTDSFRGLTHSQVYHPSRGPGAGAISCVSRKWCALGTDDGNIYIGRH